MSRLNRWHTPEEVKLYFSNSINDLERIASHTHSSKVYDPECARYCEWYAKHFNERRNQRLRILEIGVKNGDSLLMWKEYFPNSKIFGLEYNPEPLVDFNHEDIEVFIGDQSDVELLERIAKEAGPFDIIIDDASHVMEHHQISFNYLFVNALNKDGGVYVIEDLGTSYWAQYGGGLLRETATIEVMKNLVDNINYRFYKGDRKEYVGIPPHDKTDATYFDLNVEGISFYKGMCFIQKGNNCKYCDDKQENT